MVREQLPAPPLPLARADLQARVLRAALDRVALALAGVARRFVDERCWLAFGHARLEDHARERFSRSGRWLRDLAALARAVESLPGLAAALTGADGCRPLGRVAALLIGRVASPDSLAAWVELARRSTVRELRQAVRWARSAEVSFPPGAAEARSSLPDSGPGGTTFDEGRANGGAASGGALGGGPAVGGEDGDNCDDDEARTQVRLPVPSAVRAAFDETLDLYRAVVGREASVTSFVEDLVAEASSGPHPPDAEQRALHRAAPAARVEEAMAQTTSGWRQIDDEVLAGLPGGAGVSAHASHEGPSSLATHSASAAGHSAQTATGRSGKAAGLPPDAAGLPLSDEAWLTSLRRDRGTARRRLADLARLALSTRVSNDRLYLRLPAWLADSFLSTLESARQSAESARSFSVFGTDGSSSDPARSFSVDIGQGHPIDPARSSSSRRRPLPTWVGLLALLDEFVATWDPPAEGSSGRGPAVEAIYARDGWRCMAPGCTSRRNLEDHHLVYRSRGGGNEAENRICLCRFHHQRGEHGGLARCRGWAPLGVVWSLGRGGLGGGFRNERALGSSAISAAVQGAHPGGGGADCAL